MGLVLILILAAGLAGADALNGPEKPFAFGVAFSYTAGLLSPWMIPYMAPGIEVSARLCAKAEFEAFLFYNSSILLAGGEVRLSPRIGAWLPFVGIGYFYARAPAGALSENQATYASLGLLRFSLEDLASVVTGKGYGFFISLLEIRWGPFIAQGPRWIYSTGNFLAEVDILKIGLFF
jgi:hypothetical protein